MKVVQAWILSSPDDIAAQRLYARSTSNIVPPMEPSIRSITLINKLPATYQSRKTGNMLPNANKVGSELYHLGH